MSFEGYFQLWCIKGHYFIEDAYADHMTECPICKSKMLYENLVDDTNGDNFGYLIPVSKIHSSDLPPTYLIPTRLVEMGATRTPQFYNEYDDNGVVIP